MGLSLSMMRLTTASKPSSSIFNRERGLNLAHFRGQDAPGFAMLRKSTSVRAEEQPTDAVSDAHVSHPKSNTPMSCTPRLTGANAIITLSARFGEACPSGALFTCTLPAWLC
jgi:hypothetical protein